MFFKTCTVHVPIFALLVFFTLVHRSDSSHGSRSFTFLGITHEHLLAVQDV